MRFFYASVLVACSLLTTSCGDDEGFTFSPAPSASVVVINAMPTSPVLTVANNNITLGSVGFGQATPISPVLPQIPLDLSASFLNDSQEQIVLESSVTLDIGFTQTIVLTGTVDNPTTTVILDAPADFAEGTTDAGIRFMNATSNVASATVNIINPNGTDDSVVLTNGQPAGITTTTAGAGVQIEVRDTSSNALLWESGTFTLTAGVNRQFILIDYFGPGTQTVRMRSFNEPSAGAIFFNEVLPSAVRFTNQTANRGDLDFYIDDTLAATLPFNGVSDFIIADSGDRTIRITPAGDNTVELASSIRTFFLGFFQTLQAASDADGTGVGTGFLSEQRRPVSTQAVVNVTKLAPVITTVDMYFQNEGEGLVGNADFNQLTDFTNATVNVVPQTYDLYVTEAGNQTVLIGPVTVDLERLGFYSIQITESAGGGTPLQLQLLDDF